MFPVLHWGPENSKYEEEKAECPSGPAVFETRTVDPEHSFVLSCLTAFSRTGPKFGLCTNVHYASPNML